MDQPEGGTSAATWIATALVVMPFLQLLPVDFDRSGALILLLPALWAGRGEVAAAFGKITGRRRFAIAAALLAIAIALSVALSDHPAPALVTAAEWVLLVAVALIAGRLVRTRPGAGNQMLAGLALGAAAATVVVWLWWLTYRIGGMPLYAHHRHLGLHTLPAAVASTALALRSDLAGGNSASPQTHRRLLPRVRRRWLAVGIICWAGLLWSGGRGPLIALAGALGVWLVVDQGVRRRLMLVSAVQLIGGLALSAAFWTPRPELGWWHAFERTAAATSTGDVSALTSTRSEGWRESLRHALNRPWTGHGPDAYRFLTPKLDGQQPHNVVLQAWLDLGFVAGTAAAAILFGMVVLGWRRAGRGQADQARIPWLATLTALLLAACLDGVFYHLLAFLPAMIAAGVVGVSAAPSESPRSHRPASANVAVLLAGLVLALHTFLFYAVAVATPPATPEAATAGLLRAFPSTTYRLWRWTDAWRPTRPDDALAWTRWAQVHAPNAPLFHVRAAQLLLQRGDRTGALAELEAAEAKAHWTARPDVAKMHREVEAAPR